MQMASEEVPICRVCRSEATPEEPLFFPCRCSGSIKYVHQNCLEEWLAHSNKKYCELCGHEFAFSPLYDPNMPESIPKHLIVKQMLANVSMIVLQVIRTVLVLGTWGFLLPYMVYWIARVLIWSAKVVIHSSIPGEVFLDRFWEIDTTNMTSMVASANMRFKGYDSWRQWYIDYHQNVTVPPISSRTGILNGANNFADFVYAGTLTFVTGWVSILSAATGYTLPTERVYNLTELIAELVSKSFEGSIVVLISLITFFILFILRDWIVANAPLDPDMDADDIIEGDEQVEQEEVIGAAAEQQPPAGAPAARPVMQEMEIRGPEPAPAPEPEPELLRPLADRHDIAARDQGVLRVPRHGQQDPWQTTMRRDLDAVQGGADDQVGGASDEQRGLSSGLKRDGFRNPAIHHSVLTRGDAGSTSNIARDRNADDSSNESDEEEALKRRLRDIIMSSPALDDDALPKQEIGSGSSSRVHESSTRQSNTWSYADEVYQDQSGSDAESELESERESGAHSPFADKANAYLAADGASHTAPGGYLGAANADADGSFWSSVVGEASNAAADNGAGQHNPQVFTSEVPPVILALVDPDGSGIISSMSYDERVHFIERRLADMKRETKKVRREDLVAVLSGEQSWDSIEEIGSEELPLPASDPALHQQEEWKHQLAHVLADLVDDPADADARINTDRRHFLAQRELAEELNRRIGRQQQEELERRADQERQRRDEEEQQQQQQQQQQQRRVADQAQQANQGQNGNQNGLGIDFDENFGDLEAADGILEAMGLRGPFFNAIQYFMMLLLIVAVVLSLCVWTPMIIGRLFLALNPMRQFLYLVDAFSSAIDSASELVFDRLLPFVWMLVRPVLVRAVNLAGPFAVAVVTPFAPSLKAVLSSSDSGGSLWDKLTSAQVRDLVVEQLRQPSSIVQLLFPWVSAPESGSDASDSAALGLPLALSAAGNLANSAVEGPSEPTNSLMGSVAGGFIGDLVRQALGHSAADQIGVQADIQDPSELLNLQAWERELWGRLDKLGIPIYWLALKLRAIASALTLTDRALLILIGNLVCVYVAWNIVSYMPRQNRRSVVYQTSRMFLLMAKIVYFIFIEVVLFPMLCGYCLDIALTPLIPDRDKTAHYRAILNNSPSRRAIYWGLGLFFMLQFARCVSYCRHVARPGLLWFIRDPNDPDFHPMREALEGRTVSQQTKIWRSAVMYCGALLVCFGAPSYATTLIAPGTFPMTYPKSAWTADFPHSMLLSVVLLAMMIQWGEPYEMARALLSFWWRFAARVVRLSEFIIGVRDVLDEGRWELAGYPQVPVVLPRLWMPTRVVTEAFEEVSLEASDRARDGERGNAVPTSEFRARLQSRIDIGLMQRHPWVRFVLDGQNIRAPAVDTVSVVPGRKMLVPVDDLGRPAEDKHDYEAADYPERRGDGDGDGDDDDDVDEQRDLPAAAPESSFRDLRFKPAQHKVIYVPPGLRVRVFAFMALIWVLVAAMFVTTVVSSMYVGRVLWTVTGKQQHNDYLVFPVGLMGVIMLSTRIYQAGSLVAGLFGRNGSVTRALGDSIRQIYQGWVSGWKLLVTASVFFVFLPVLYGLVLEVYVVVVLREYVDNKEAESIFAHTSVQAVKHNWLFSSLNTWVLVSALRWFPDTRLARAVDRLFTGPPHTWQVWRGIVEIGLPIGGVALAAAGLPFAATFLQMWMRGELTWEAAHGVLFMSEIKQLARNALVIMVTATSLALVWWACIVYKRWSRLARDQVYRVGQQLHNIDEDARSNDGSDEGEGEDELAGNLRMDALQAPAAAA